VFGKTTPSIITTSILVLYAGVLPASADLSIAKRVTKNVSCTGGSCVATSRNAVMNVTDLQNLLASQPTVSLDAGPAKNIAVNAALTWTSANALSLKAKGEVAFDKPVTVAGNGGVSLQSPVLYFAHKASLTFWNLSSALSVNGNAYQLVGDVNGLSQAVHHNASGHFALANDYDASAEKDFTYLDPLYGMFTGLGHTISNVTLGMPYDFNYCGFFGENYGVISYISVHVVETDFACEQSFGNLVGRNVSLIDHAHASGKPSQSYNYFVGGLVGINDYGGRITASSASGGLVSGDSVGGLVGMNGGTIDQSFATGQVRTEFSYEVGGLVGEMAAGGEHQASVTNSYAIVDLKSSANTQFYGGLIGDIGAQTSVTGSYSASRIAKHKPYGQYNGGVVGLSNAPADAFTNCYWDIDSGVSDPSQGAGNIKNDPGLTGLSDSQLKSGLPSGLDPKIWASDPKINNGYPYLLANPPQ
jgi:hypothetical protein